VQSDVESLFARFIPLLQPAQLEANAQEQQLLEHTERLVRLTETFHTFQREMAR
jgi:hypothetical protein